MAGTSTTNRDFGPDGEIRLVLVGKTGNGKSASGNTILGRKAFKSSLSAVSVTEECEKAKGFVDGCRVAVIDTPGIYDTKYMEVEVVQRLKECICYAAPGPHVFVIVVTLGRFTEEEQKTVELLQQVFGIKAADYCLVLFTQGDQLGEETIEQYFEKSEKLCDLIFACKMRYHVFNNKNTDRSQVTQLLAKIKRIIRKNRDTFYTNAMFQEAEKAIQEEMIKNMKATAKQKRKEEMELREIIRGEQLQEMLKMLEDNYKMKAREKAEKKNKFFGPGLALAAAEVGLAIGAAAGAPGGPVCIGIGAVVGGVVGGIVGLVVPKAVSTLKKRCMIQ